MSLIFPWNSKSSSAPSALPSSSSAPSPEAQSIASQAKGTDAGTPPTGVSPSGNIPNWIAIGLTVLGLIVGGLVSYFVTLMSVKDMINQNTTNIGIHGQKLEIIADTIKMLESDSAKIQRLETDLAILCLKLQMSSVCSRR